MTLVVKMKVPLSLSSRKEKSHLSINIAA